MVPRSRSAQFVSMFFQTVLSLVVAISSAANASVSPASFFIAFAASQDAQLAGLLSGPPTNNAQNMNEDERPCESPLFCHNEKHTHNPPRPELPSTYLFIQAVYPRGLQLSEEGEAEGFAPAI